MEGAIIRAYAPGRNEGIDIGAAAGSPVRAADAGTVAAITTNTDGVQIVVIRHEGDLLTVYTHVDGLAVERGSRVSRGQRIGEVRAGDPAFLHFEVRARHGKPGSDRVPALSGEGGAAPSPLRGSPPEYLRTCEGAGEPAATGSASLTPRRPARSVKYCQATRPDRAPRVACHSIASARRSASSISTP